MVSELADTLRARLEKRAHRLPGSGRRVNRGSSILAGDGRASSHAQWLLYDRLYHITA